MTNERVCRMNIPIVPSEYCDLLTGFHVIPTGDTVCLMQSELSWPLWVSLRTWEEYRKFCERKGFERGKGPFHNHVQMGGEG